MDNSRIPFSTFGSWLAIQWTDEGKMPGLQVRSVHGTEATSPLLRVELSRRKEITCSFSEKNDGFGHCFLKSIEQVVSFQDLMSGAWREKVSHADPTTRKATIDMSPEQLTLEEADGIAWFCMPDENRIGFRASRCILQFMMEEPPHFTTVLPTGENSCEINALMNRYRMVVHRGSLAVDAPWDGVSCTHVALSVMPDETDVIEGVLEECREVHAVRVEPLTYSENLERAIRRSKAWDASVEHYSQGAPETVRQALYLNWSSIVAPVGYVQRPVMLMSKGRMNRLWSWDHCFNALMLAQIDPELAWHQFMAPFDLQDGLGSLPDCYNDTLLIRNFVKPPIHGWTLLHLMKHCTWLGDDRIREAYAPLARWTSWWLTERDPDGNGIPQYNHGNDSGWDNATLFGEGVPVESPDLCAFLILQMEALGSMATRLGMPAEAKEWETRSAQLLQDMIAHFWQEGRFVAYRLNHGKHEPVVCDSLLRFMPLLLGRRLPKDILDTLTQDLLTGGFMTDYGLATENPSSAQYRPDGYWRGPIWAPTTLLLIDGLNQSGFLSVAEEIAGNFRGMVEREGFAENFNALDGTALRDRAYTWTSSVYLLLSRPPLFYSD